MSKTLSEAMNFSFDVQEKTQEGKSIREAIFEAIKNYPDAKIRDDILFNDGSIASLTDGWLQVK